MAWTSSGAMADAPDGELQPALLEVQLNGRVQGEAIVFLRDAAGRIYAPKESLAAWRLRDLISDTITYDGATYIALTGLKGLSLKYSDETQSLAITAAPELFAPTTTTIGTAASGPMTKSAHGGFLNYEFFSQYVDGKVSLNGSFEIGAFTPGGYGTSTFIMPWNDGNPRLVRLDSSWTIDDTKRMRSLRLGDTITRGGIGGTPMRIGGVQFARNFAVDPGFVTLPMPSLSGTAALPSTVDIYVDNILRSRQDVPVGPFRVADVPLMNGAGDVRLVVRDAFGRESVVSQRYYASTQILRKGLHDYSYEAGFLRRDYAKNSNSYGDFVLSGTHRYGFTDWLTGEVHAEATMDKQMAGVSTGMLLPGIGLLSASAAVSHSKDGSGHLIGAGFERNARSLNFGVKTELASRNYTNLGYAPGRRPAAQTTQAFASLPTDFGSVGVNYLLRDNRDEPDTESLGANANFRIGRIGSLHLTAQRSLSGQKNTTVGAFLSIPLGPRRSALTSVQQQAGRTTVSAMYQQSLPEGAGFGYRATVEHGAVNRYDGKLSYQSDIGAYDVEVARTNGATGARATVSGSVGFIRDHGFAARKLNQSFAAVKVGDVKGVRVYADNQPVAKTNANGVAIIPRLRPYEKNMVRVEAGDLPMDVLINEVEKPVRPFNRSGVSLSFKAVQSRGAVMTVVLEDGTPLPAGSTLRVEGGSDEFVSAQDGMAYVAGLGERSVVRAGWDNKSCTFIVSMPKTDDPQPDLGTVQCKVSQ